MSLASHHYFDRDVGRMAIKLLPSEYYVTTDHTVLSTVLGSCVAACLHDAQAGVAGMNHFMLPDDGEPGGGSMRYGAYAMDVLVRELVRAGARRERLQAKVFGGGAVLAGMTTLNIGDRNADFVLRYLKAEEIRVAAQDLRGPHARRVSYFPVGGLALVRRLTRQDDEVSVARDERALARAIATSARAPARAPERTPELFARQSSTRPLP